MNERKMNDDVIQLPRCPGTIEIPSREEKECLEKMRAIKERVRELKAQARTVSDLPTPAGKKQILIIDKELMDLKRQWDGWEKKRLAAEKERMIILGHLEADTT